MAANCNHVLLFDLGHVVVEVTGEQDIKPYLKGPLRTDGSGWPAMEAWEAFEKGLLTPQAFSERFVVEADLNIDAAGFLANFEGWTRGFFPGAKETLDALRPRFRLAALGVPEHFERSFASHELGIRKPGREIYELVLVEMDVAAADVTFFDDQQLNVDAAKQAGMNAHRVKGIDELRACLRELSYL